MNMYLGYFEKEENTEGDTPPIGIVLAKECFFPTFCKQVSTLPTQQRRIRGSNFKNNGIQIILLPWPKQQKKRV
jgi:hypothetical protein